MIDTIEGCCPMCHAFLSLGPLWDHGYVTVEDYLVDYGKQYGPRLPYRVSIDGTRVPVACCSMCGSTVKP